MCGIAALLRDEGMAPETLRRMADAARHRGPDDAGEAFFRPGNGGGWGEISGADGAWRLGLAHRRLSIIDLSPRGRQPMSYRGRYWTVFNGEIYNYVELAEELAPLGHSFTSSSDTEILLAAFAEWGPDCFQRFRGMWAIVLLDAGSGRLFVSRDRFGIKPLYTWSLGRNRAFVSEIKQLCTVPGFRARLDGVQADEFLATGYERPERTFFDGVVPLSPGTYVEVELQGGDLLDPVSYWTPERVSVSIHRVEEAVEAIRPEFERSIALHRRSDVLVGCALSGGLDSSGIAEALSRLGEGAGVHTFTASFPGTNADETRFVQELTRTLGTVEHTVVPTPAQYRLDLPDFVWHQDEPVGGLSIYAGFAVARLTREAGIKVSLNGQGGDEAFAGYWQQYLFYLWTCLRSGAFAEVAKHLVGSMTGRGNPQLLAQLPEMTLRWAGKRRRVGGGRSTLLGEMTRGGRETLRVAQLRRLFLPRLLRWEDRNSMAFGVEGRYPFLDHRLIEVCLACDEKVLYSRGWVKWPLRLILDGRVPHDVAWRKDKKGFEVPTVEWLSGPLRPDILASLREPGDVLERQAGEDCRSLARRLGNEQNPSASLLERCFRFHVFERWTRRFEVAA